MVATFNDQDSSPKLVNSNPMRKCIKKIYFYFKSKINVDVLYIGFYPI